MSLASRAEKERSPSPTMSHEAFCGAEFSSSDAVVVSSSSESDATALVSAVDTSECCRNRDRGCVRIRPHKGLIRLVVLWMRRLQSFDTNNLTNNGEGRRRGKVKLLAQLGRRKSIGGNSASISLTMLPRTNSDPPSGGKSRTLASNIMQRDRSPNTVPEALIFDDHDVSSARFRLPRTRFSLEGITSSAYLATRVL